MHKLYVTFLMQLSFFHFFIFILVLKCMRTLRTFAQLLGTGVREGPQGHQH